MRCIGSTKVLNGRKSIELIGSKPEYFHFGPKMAASTVVDNRALLVPFLSKQAMSVSLPNGNDHVVFLAGRTQMKVEVWYFPDKAPLNQFCRTL